MKRTFLSLLILLVFTALQARNTLPASDGRITYVGRTLVQEGTVSFDWSGVYTRIAFTGGYLALEASDTGKDFFNIWIDRDPSAEPDRTVVVQGDTTVVLFEARERKPLPHRLTIQKRTEGEQGLTTFRAFILDGTLLQAEPLKERVIEVVGDSYTCGYGSENSVREDPFRPQDENPAKTYIDILGRYFGADVVRTAHSGQGIARNYNDAGRGRHMPERYLQVFDTRDEPRWDAARIAPDITVIYLCTNDFSTGRQPLYSEFRAQYMKLLRQIKKNYGENHPILCVASRSDRLCHEYVWNVVEACGMENVSFMGLGGSIHDNEGDLGASWHPNYTGHLKKAYAMLPYIATLTGWSLEEKPLL